MLQRRLEAELVMHVQVGTTAGIVLFVGLSMGKNIWQMGRRLEEQKHGRWASAWRGEKKKNPTGDSCSVAGA